MMSMTKTVAALVTALVAAPISKTALPDELTTARELAPNQSIAFQIDDKAVLSYFTSENGKCKAVMWVAPPAVWEDKVATFATVKYEADIPIGKSGRFVPSPGRIFALECQPEAQLLVIRPVKPGAAASIDVND